MRHQMRLLYVKLLWTASLNAALIQAQQVSLKTQLVPDASAYFSKAPGCMALGEYSHELDFIREEPATTPQECWQACADSYQSSYLRGVYFKTNYEGEYAYAGASIYYYGYTCYSSYGCKSEYDWYNGNGTVRPNSWIELRVFPCYDISLYDNDGSESNINVPASNEFQNVLGSSLEQMDTIEMFWYPSAGYICTLGSSAPSNFLEACASWEFHEQDGTCRLYQGSTSLGSIVNNNLVNGTIVSGDLSCQNDFDTSSVPRRFARFYEERGCLQYGVRAPNYDLAKYNDIPDPHACRRLCQENSQCVLIRYMTDPSAAPNCLLKSAGAMANWLTDSSGYLGTRDCHTCLDGFYIQNQESLTDSCYICDSGYYCPLGNHIPCPGGSYCVAEGLTEPVLADQDNQCSLTRSGVACQHQVCRDSILGLKLLQLEYQTPDAFNFTLYEAGVEFLGVQQNIEETFTGELQLSHTFQYALAINWYMAPPTYEARYVIDGQEIGWYLLDQNEVGTDCLNMDQHYITTDLNNLVTQMPVGTSFDFCINILWMFYWRPQDWELSDFGSESQMPEVKVCKKNLTIHFHSKINFLITTLDGHTTQEEVSVVYKTYTPTTGYTSHTSNSSDADGRISQEIFDHEANMYLQISLQSASKVGVNTDIRLCPPLASFDICNHETAIPLPYEMVLTHLLATQVRFVDVYSLTIAGTIVMAVDQTSPVSEHWCGKAEVKVIARSVRTGLIFSQSITDSEGGFTLTVPRDTDVKLEVEYADHLFEAASSNDTVTAALLGSGIQVSANLDQIIIHDIKTQQLSFSTYITACQNFPDQVKIILTYEACANKHIVLTPSEIYSEWALPAASYTFSIEYPTLPQMRDAFEATYPNSTLSRFIDMREHNQTIEVIYNPQPNISITTTSQVGDKQEHSSTTSLLFDIMLEGSRNVDFYITASQQYVNEKLEGRYLEWCYCVPEDNRTTATMFSTLASDYAPEVGLVSSVLCSDQMPCSLNFSTVPSYNTTSAYSFIQHSLYVAPPQISTNETFPTYKELTDYVKEVRINVRNDRFWPQGFNTTLRVLVLGSNALDLSESVLLTTPEVLPLFYLYAPPIVGVANTEEFAHAHSRATLEGAFLIQSTISSVLPFVLRDREQAPTIQASATFESLSLEVDINGFNITTLQADLAVVNDEVVLLTDPVNFTLQTTSEGEDMVLLLVSKTSIISTSTLTYNYTTNSLETSSSISWNSRNHSVILRSRSECELQVKKLETLMNLYTRQPELFDEDSSENLGEFMIRAKYEQDEWLNLLDHWDSDKRTARQYPLHMTRETASDSSQEKTSSSQLTLSSEDEIYIEDSVLISSETRFADYESLLNLGYQNINLALSPDISALGYFIPRSGLNSSDEREGLVEVLRRRSTVDFVNASTDIASQVLFRSELFLPNGGNNNTLCVEIFQSPYSGSHVYDVCGGRTSCPHISGTDAIEDFEIYFNESSESLLVEDSGEISLYIDATAMLLENSSSLDLVISLDVAENNSSDIRYGIVTESFDRPLALSVASGTRALISINYQRLDPNVRFARALMRVTSACDPNIEKQLQIDLNWVSVCPLLEWMGSLSNYDANWFVSTSAPVLQIEYVQKVTGGIRDFVESQQSLWGATYDSTNGRGEWIKLNDIVASESTSKIEVSGESLLTKFGAGQVVLELRSSCMNDGEVIGVRYSGERIGTIDFERPSVLTWAASSGFRKPVLSFPVVKFRFNEPIDCSALQLSARVYSLDEDRSLNAVVSCSSHLYEIGVVVSLPRNSSDMLWWSEADAHIELMGVQDLWGNTWLENSIVSDGTNMTKGRRLEDASMTHGIRFPSLVNSEGDEPIFEWEVADSSEVFDMVEVAIQNHFSSSGVQYTQIYAELDLLDEYDSYEALPRNDTNNTATDDRPGSSDEGGEENSEDTDYSEDADDGSLPSGSKESTREVHISTAGITFSVLFGLILVSGLIYGLILRRRKLRLGLNRVAPIPKRAGFAEEGQANTDPAKENDGGDGKRKITEDRAADLTAEKIASSSHQKMVNMASRFKDGVNVVCTSAAIPAKLISGKKK